VAIYGVDIHPRFQPTINIEEIRREGFDFMAVKASDGVDISYLAAGSADSCKHSPRLWTPSECPACSTPSHEMDQLPPTTMPADPDSDPRSWLQRNYDVGFDVAGGWEGGFAFGFGAQDWAGRTVDAARDISVSRHGSWRIAA
jgi:hypothetical protein